MCKPQRVGAKHSDGSIGGAANTYIPTEEEKLGAQQHNEHVRSESSNGSHSKERASVKAMADKAKELLKGGKPGEEKK